jgi:hypothetical protein
MGHNTYLETVLALGEAIEALREFVALKLEIGAQGGVGQHMTTVLVLGDALIGQAAKAADTRVSGKRLCGSRVLAALGEASLGHFGPESQKVPDKAREVAEIGRRRR